MEHMRLSPDEVAEIDSLTGKTQNKAHILDLLNTVNSKAITQDSVFCMERKEQLALLQAFFIAASAKDCSLMIAMKAVSSGDYSREGSLLSKTLPIVEPFPNSVYTYNVSMVDLDLKPFSKIPYYIDLDRRVVSNFLSLGLDFTCVRSR